MEIDNIVLGVVSALIGGGCGLYAAFWRTRYSVREADFSKRIEEICSAIGKLEEKCCVFYSGEDINKEASKPYILGMKTKIQLLANFLNKEYSGFYTPEISTLAGEFFDACTGDSFEENETKVDPQRQRLILITGETLKIEIMRARRTKY